MPLNEKEVSLTVTDLCTYFSKSKGQQKVMEPWRGQVNNPIGSSHLPSKIFAPQRISDLLTHGSFDKPHKKIVKKYTTTTTTTTTRPPIVWFPGDPDCNETAPSGIVLKNYWKKST